MNHRREAALKKYCSKVKKHLICSPSTKDDLIAGLYNELVDASAEQMSYEELETQFGSPKDLAKELQDSVDEKERNEAKNRQKRIKLALLFSVLALVLLSVTATLFARHIWNSTPSYYTDEIREHDENDTISPDIIWDED